MKISFFEHALAMVLSAVAFMVLPDAKPWVVVLVVLAGQYLMLRQRMEKDEEDTGDNHRHVERIKGPAPTPIESISASWKDMKVKEPKGEN